MQTETAKLVVIDDIRSVVEMITQKVPWEQYGIEVVGKARDGEEGLAVIEAARPDIVLTDIRMPKMDGLTMTERILQMLPGCKIIILSGYTDFEYARKAVQLGAIDFIRKPFTMNEILEVALKAKELWAKEERHKLSLEKLKNQVKASMPVLRQEHLNMLVQYPASDQKALEIWNFLELGIPPRNLTVLAVDIDDPQHQYLEQPVQEIELMRFSLQNILEETIRMHTQGVLFRESTLRFILIIHSAEPEESMRIAEECCANIRQYTKFTVSIGVGLPASSIMGLSDSYQQAKKALSYHFYTGGNAVFHYKTITSRGTAYPIYSFKHEETLVFALQSGNKEIVMETLDKLVEDIHALRPHPDPEQIVGLFMLWASVIYRTLAECLPAEKCVHLEKKIQLIRTGSNLSLQGLSAVLHEIADEGCNMIQDERQSESQKIIRTAIEHILTHLGDELTVDRCARVVNLSGGYFANLFKKETGKTFNQFVTQERIERAKKLLVQNVPVQEIAAVLGYEHRRYFSDVFKKHTGMTPSEFKDFYLSGKQNANL